jgi:hypothetical protein
MFSEFSINTPALLFSAISLLMLAYTNRFLALAQLIRSLHAQYKEKPEEIISLQMHNLHKRLYLIRNMQILGISSLLLCVISMFLIYISVGLVAKIIFGIALLLLIISLAISIWEINISVKALEVRLSDIELKK